MSLLIAIASARPLLGMFWERATSLGAMLPFMDRVGVVFLACIAIAIAVVLSLLQNPDGRALRVELRDIDYSTSTGFNVSALIVAAILAALYAWWR